MNSEISKNIELLSNKDDPQDKKLLLLASLVEERFDDISSKQEVLAKSLQGTSDKVNKLVHLLEGDRASHKDCPMYKNKVAYERLTLLITSPRILIIIVIGVLAVLSGFGINISDVWKKL